MGKRFFLWGGGDFCVCVCVGGSCGEELISGWVILLWQEFLWREALCWAVISSGRSSCGQELFAEGSFLLWGEALCLGVIQLLRGSCVGGLYSRAVLVGWSSLLGCFFMGGCALC